MTALEDARAALAKYYAVSQGGYGAGEHQNLAGALRTLIAEHERLTAPPTDDERAGMSPEEKVIYILRRSFHETPNDRAMAHIARAIVDTINEPPADDEREALAQMIADAEAHPSLKRPPSVQPLAGDYRAADAILASGFRRQGPITDEWVLAPDGEEFRPGECQGHAQCPVAVHVHGCFADVGNCDDPESHEPTEAAGEADR